MRLRASLFCVAMSFCGSSYADEVDSYVAIDRISSELESKVISWRRDIHEHPELGNREFRTSTLVGDHLEQLGFDEVQRNIAHTGVVGILEGGRPGGVVALRADMDALPVTEKTLLPFASTLTTTYNGQKVGVNNAIFI